MSDTPSNEHDVAIAEVAADAAVEIAEAQAEAATEIAETQAEVARDLEAELSACQTSLQTMDQRLSALQHDHERMAAEHAQMLSQLSSIQSQPEPPPEPPPNPEPEPVAEVEVEAEPEPAEEPKPPERKRMHRWM